MDVNQVRSGENWQRFSIVAVSGSLVAVAILGASNGLQSGWKGAGASLILAFACLLSGGFLGFLFGIPRSQQNPPSGNSKINERSRDYSENTNLEQISDWLTKIIVGVTLIQFTEIASSIYTFASEFGPAVFPFSDPKVSAAVTFALILYFGISGFLFLYLWTRIYLEGEFRRTSANLIKEIEGIFSYQQVEQSQKDSAALDIVNEFLDSNADPSAEKFKPLEVIIKESSAVSRTLIFDKAHHIRSKYWNKNASGKALVTRTIRVFRGLIAANPERAEHRTFAQLGYALKDQTNPDWAEAAKVLKRAIELRNDPNDQGRGYYQFNLALCLINLDPNFAAGNETETRRRDEIAALLDKGKNAIPLNSESAIVSWSNINRYTIGQ